MHCVLPDGHEGFPGKLEVTVKYLLTEQNELVIDYLAKSDKDTVINLTNHAFFNLNKTHSETILDNKLLIGSSEYLAVDANAIPTGEIKDVKNTPFDFTSFKAIGKDIKEDNEQLKNARGYDVTFPLEAYPSKDGTSFFAAALTAPSTGLRLEILTTEPSVHLYTGNFLEGADLGKDNIPCAKHSAVCLETQHFPDSPNQKNFPTTTLNPGETYSHLCIYKFEIK
jgi:aldose 1-epimerase